jgi:response regulator of citrate/malate metabolism
MALGGLGRVMLIDDSKVDNFINSKVLELSKRANDVKVFDDASDALEYLSTTTSELPDLIFLDIYMPTMSGFDFLEEFEKLPESRKKNTRIMLLSSAYDTLEVEKLKKYDWLSGCVVKPLTYEILQMQS